MDWCPYLDALAQGTNQNERRLLVRYLLVRRFSQEVPLFSPF